MVTLLLPLLFGAAIVFLGFAIPQLCRYWGKPELESQHKATILAEMTAIAVGIIALFITFHANRAELFSTLDANRNETTSLIHENRQDALCQYNQTIVKEIVELIVKVSHEVQYEIGIPSECFDKRDGSDYVAKNPAIIPAFEQFRLDGGLLAYKVGLLLVQQENHHVFDAHMKFDASVRELQAQCRDYPDYSEDEYKKARATVTDSGSALVHELSNLMLHCYQRIPPEMLVRPPTYTP